MIGVYVLALAFTTFGVLAVVASTPDSGFFQVIGGHTLTITGSLASPGVLWIGGSIALQIAIIVALAVVRTRLFAVAVVSLLAVTLAVYGLRVSSTFAPTNLAVRGVDVHGLLRLEIGVALLAAGAVLCALTMRRGRAATSRSSPSR